MLLAPSFDWMLAGLGARARRSDVRVGSMLSKKGFCDEWRATSIQEQMKMRNLDSKTRPPGIRSFQIPIPQFVYGDFFDSIGHLQPSSAGVAYRPLPQPQQRTFRQRPFYEYTPIPHLVRWGRAHGAGDPIRQRDSLGRQEK